MFQQRTSGPDWVVVERAGTDMQDVWSEHGTFLSALREYESCGGADEGYDVMHRLPDGTLTTDF